MKTVGIVDPALVEAAFDSTPTIPNWNPSADINNDAIVNVVDPCSCGSEFRNRGAVADQYIQGIPVIYNVRHK